LLADKKWGNADMHITQAVWHGGLGLMDNRIQKFITGPSKIPG